MATATAINERPPIGFEINWGSHCPSCFSCARAAVKREGSYRAVSRALYEGEYPKQVLHESLAIDRNQITLFLVPSVET